MVEPWLDVVERITEFFATAQIEACARRTGFVRRTSKTHGQGVSSLGDVRGPGVRARTSLGQLAAKAASYPRRWTCRPKRGFVATLHLMGIPLCFSSNCEVEAGWHDQL